MSFPGFGHPPALYFLWILPRNLFSRICGWYAELRIPHFILHPLIRLFCLIYKVDLSESERPLEGFDSFNAFFTRKLKPGLRPFAPEKEAVLSPVDGTLGEFGKIRKEKLIQSKGLDYRLQDLILDPGRVAKYDEGLFITLYLAPHNYHRIHSIADSEVLEFAYIPGDLWTVSPLGVKKVPELFARNERLVTYLETEYGECAIVKVGATVVGKIRVKYHQQVTNLRDGEKKIVKLDLPWQVKRGEEIGLFELGSSVICLFSRGQVELDDLQIGKPVRFGQSLGRFVN